MKNNTAHYNGRTRLCNACGGGFLLGLLLLAPGAQGSVIFVDASQTNNPADGTSWATAFPRLQQGIDAAATNYALWVAASVYFESLTVKAGVALYGGFAGNESQVGQRDIMLNPTILDGGQSNRVVTFAEGATNTTRLDGFVVRNGNAVYGAGMLCYNTSPVIVSNIITQNVGGAIRCDAGAAPLIAFNLVQQNATGNAIVAGIECLNSGARIQNNRIVGNYAGPGGGIAGGISCFGIPSPEIYNNLIAANIASTPPINAAGIYVVNSNCAPRIINNTMEWNSGYCIVGASSLAVIADNIITFSWYGVSGMPGMTFQNNCVYGNISANYTGFPDPTGSNGNISADPLFASNNYLPDIHLTASSPCRDAGNTAFVQPDWLDIDGQTRVVGSAVDIGADEFNGAVPVFIPAIVRVSPAGNDRADGSTWAKAKRTIQAAIDATTVNGGEVWVQSATHNECLTLRHFVYLYGGFAGTETNRNQRDWKANPTIIDGGQRGASVITADQLLKWNTIDGFTIQNGKAPKGGGIYCNHCTFPILNNIIQGNWATDTNSYHTGWGGGIWLSWGLSLGSPMISNNVISLNRARQGGGIYCGGSSAAIIANNLIHSNVAAVIGTMGGSIPPGGGGIYLDTVSYAQILNNLLLANVATNAPGDSTVAYGGGIACAGYTSSPRIIGNTFLSNVAASPNHFLPDYGGGIGTYSLQGTIVNNILAFGSSGLFTLSTTSGPGNRVSNNCVYGNGTNYVYADLTGTNGNISVDPLFAATNDFHLMAASPCINAGDNSVVARGSLDLDGQVRIAGGTVDIGADEYGSAMPFAVSLRMEAGGGLLSVQAETNRVYVFERSNDLLGWTPFCTNAATNVSLEIPEPARSSGNAFYRVQVLP